MKNKILPIIAGVLVVAAIFVVIFVPKNNPSETMNNPEGSSATNVSEAPQHVATKNSYSKLATLDEDGNVIINQDEVSEDKISFLKYAEDSKIELIAIKGADGNVNVALRNLSVM